MIHLDPSERLRRANEIVREMETVFALAEDVRNISNGKFDYLFIPEGSSIEELRDEIGALEEERDELKEALKEIESICFNHT